MLVKSRIEQDIVVLEPVGELDVFTVEKLRDAFRACVVDGHVDLAVDLGAVTFMDSSGLGVLVGGLKRVRARNGSLRLVRPSPILMQVLSKTGLTSLFGVYDSIDALLGDTSSGHLDQE